MGEVSEQDRVPALIERLPPAELVTAARFLEFMQMDPVARAVTMAPADHEPALNSRVAR